MFLPDEWALVGQSPPNAKTAATYLTEAIDMLKFHEVAFLIGAGTLGSSATADFSVTASATSGGSYAATGLTGKVITQLTQSGTDKSNTYSWVVLKSDEMPAGKRFVKGSLVVATATSGAVMLAFGRPRYYPPTDVDLTSVNEVIN